MLINLNQLEKRLAKTKNPICKSELEPVIYEVALDFLERTIEKEIGSDYEVIIKLKGKKIIYEISKEKCNSLRDITTASQNQKELIPNYREVCRYYNIEPLEEIISGRKISLVIHIPNTPSVY